MSHYWQRTFERVQNNHRFQHLTRVVVGIALLVYVTLGIQTELASIVSQPIPETLMSDFRIYVQAYGRAAQGGDPYTMGTIGQAFLYPPPALLFVGLLAAIPSELFRNAFYLALNLGFLFVILRGIAARYDYRMEQVWWWFPLAFGFAPVFETLHVGQINLVTVFGVFLMLMYADALPFVSGLGLTLAVVTKVTPVVFFAYLIVTRRYRAIVWAIVLLMVAGFASVLWFGLDMLTEYPRVFSNLSQTFVVDSYSQSLVALLHQGGWMEEGAWFQVQQFLNIYLIAVFVVSIVVALVSKQREPVFLIFALGTTVMPNVMWYHHYVFILLPIFVWLAWSRLHPWIVLWCFAGLMVVQIDRDYLARGLMSHLFVHLSILGILSWQLAHASESRVHRRLPVLVGFAAIGLIALIPFRQALLANRTLTTARAWIEQNLPVGSRLAVESELLWVDPERFTVQEMATIADHAPDWYVQNGFEYLVFRPAAFQDYAKSAVSFAQFPQAARFEDDGYTVVILKTNVTGLPSQRVAARFGLYGEWLELVGYDVELPRVTLYWRALQDRREPLLLTMRLLDRLDREIAQSSGALSDIADSGGRWREGIVRVSWMMEAPVEPGVYRLELDVDAEGVGRIPLLSRAQEPISDKVLIGPFKVSPTAPAVEDLQRAQAVNLRFGDSIILLAETMGNHLARPGDALNVTLYWQSTANLSKDFTVFVHLLDANGNLQTQVDAEPRGGAYPTSIWNAGEIVRDDYTLTLPRDLAPGDYRIEVGLYEYPALTHLIVRDTNGTTLGSQFLLNETIKVEQ